MDCTHAIPTSVACLPARWKVMTAFSAQPISWSKAQGQHAPSLIETHIEILDRLTAEAWRLKVKHQYC